jgi:hypothetical protein
MSIVHPLHAELILSLKVFSVAAEKSVTKRNPYSTGDVPLLVTYQKVNFIHLVSVGMVKNLNCFTILLNISFQVWTSDEWNPP